MADYARPTNTDSPLMNPVIYFRVSAIALSAIAIAGLLLNAIKEGDLLEAAGLEFDWTHNLLHLALAGAAFLFGWGYLPGRTVKMFAIVLGAVYGILGIVGFLDPDILDVARLHLEWAENLLHVLLGVWGLLTGISAKF